MSGDPRPDEVLARVRAMADGLRERREKAQPEGLAQRMEMVMAEAVVSEAMFGMEPVIDAIPTEAEIQDGYFHLPDPAPTQPETASNPEVEQAWERERDQLQANILTLQQERDTLRHRLAELESKLQHAEAATHPDATVQPSPAESPDFDAHDPSGHKKRMGEILVEAGVISQEQLDSLLAEQVGSKPKRIGKLLVERGITSEEMIAKVIAAQLKLPFINLVPDAVIEAAAHQISGELARRHECIPIDGDLTRLTLAMANPMDLLAIDNVELASNRRVTPVVAVPSAIAAAIIKTYG